MKKFLALALSMIMVLSLVACGSSSSSSSSSSAPAASSSSSAPAASEVVINYPTFQVGANTSAPVIAELVKQFNETYAGKYRIQIEEVPGDANYADKMKVMLTTGKLPPVVYGGGYKLLDLALEAGLVVDLTDAVNADAEWKAMYNDGWNSVNCRDGKIYASTMENQLIGYFYNKDLFAKAGIKPAETWDEFFSNLEALKAAGITPIAMDTADGAWCSQLMMGAMIATNGDEGYKFMSTKYPTNYNVAPVIDGLTKIQNMYQNYTTLDANGGAYENAANNFFSENVAIIANGPWMIGDFSDTSKTDAGFDAKVGVATYPGGFVYEAPIEGMFVTKQDDPALEEAAIAMVQFFTSAKSQLLALEMQGMIPGAATVEISQKALDSFPLLGDFLAQANNCSVRTDNFTGIMVPGLEDLWSSELPNLASGVYTPEQMAQVLTDFATANAVS